MTTWSDAVLATSPYSWLRLDEASGTVLTDSTGSGRNGSVSGTVTYRQPSLIPSEGGSGFAINKGDGGNYLLSPSLPIQTNTNGISAAVTYKGSGVGGSSRMLLGAVLPTSWGVSFAASNVELVTSSVYTDTGVPVASVADGQPHLFVATLLNGEQKLYIDGALVLATAVGMSYNNTRPVHFGYNNSSQTYLDGTFDDPTVWQRVITDAEVADLYAAWSGGPSGVSASLAGTAPAVTGDFAASFTAPPNNATLAGVAPMVTGAFTASFAAPPVSATLAGAAPSVTGAFAASRGNVVTASLAGVAPSVFGDFMGFRDVVTVPPVDTAAEFANDGYNYDGTAAVYFEPPIAETPTHIRRVKVLQVHQSMSAPVLVNGRPT